MLLHMQSNFERSGLFGIHTVLLRIVRIYILIIITCYVPIMKILTEILERVLLYLILLI